MQQRNKTSCFFTLKNQVTSSTRESSSMESSAARDLQLFWPMLSIGIRASVSDCICAGFHTVEWAGSWGLTLFMSQNSLLFRGSTGEVHGSSSHGLDRIPLCGRDSALRSDQMSAREKACFIRLRFLCKRISAVNPALL